MPTTNDNQTPEEQQPEVQPFIEQSNSIPSTPDLQDPPQPAPEPVDEGGDTEPQEVPQEMVTRAVSQYGLSEQAIDGLNVDQVQGMMDAIDRSYLQQQQFNAPQMPPQQPFPPQQGMPGQFPAFGQQPPFQGLPPQQQQPYAFGNQPPVNPPGYPSPVNYPGQPQQPQQFQLPEPPKIDRDLVDDSVADAFDTVYQQNQMLAQQLQQQQAQWQHQQQQEQWQQQQDDIAFDNQLSAMVYQKVNNLGEDYQGVVSAGNQQHIQAIKDGMYAMANAHPNATADELFDTVVRINFGQQAQVNRQKQLSQQVANRSSQTVGRPGPKGGKDPLKHQIDPTTGVSQRTVSEVDKIIQKAIAQKA